MNDRLTEPELFDDDLKANVMDCIDFLSDVSFKNAKAKGFWEDNRNRNRAECIALMHQELSELLDAERHKSPDGTPLMDQHCPEFENRAIELADLLIRAFDYAGGFGIPLGEALIAKMTFNLSRPHKHGRQF